MDISGQTEKFSPTTLAASFLFFLIEFLVSIEGKRNYCGRSALCTTGRKCQEMYIGETMPFLIPCTTDLVCCPKPSGKSLPLSLPRMENNRSLEFSDLTKHRNYMLLPGDSCGGTYLPLQIGDRVHEGENAIPGELPWISLIVTHDATGPNGHERICGGTIINDLYILTAAHCLQNKNLTRTWAKFGMVERNATESCIEGKCRPFQKTFAEKIIIHPQFEELNFRNGFDIALIRLKKRIKYDEWIQPACLPFDRTVKLNSFPLMVAGWGESGKKTKILQKMDAGIVQRPECLTSYRAARDIKSIRPSQVCAIGRRNSAVDKGDSGGGLFLKPWDGTKITIAGILSFGPLDWTLRLPAVYTKVSKYLDWVMDNINE